MPSEFVKRLRFLASGQDDLHSREIDAAANRIEQLETALQKIKKTPPFGEPQEIARAVLRIKNESPTKV